MTSADFKRHPSLLHPTIPEQICIAYEHGLDVVCTPFGGVAERLNAPVLKTGDGRPSVGSNPTSSAIYIAQLIDSVGLFCICDFQYASEYAIRCWLSYYPDGLHWTSIQSGVHVLMMFPSLRDYINQGNVALALSEIAPATAEGKPHDYLLSFHPDVISSAKSRRERTFEQSRQSLSDGAMVSV